MGSVNSSASDAQNKKRFSRIASILGPGIAIAATGVGAGDVVAATVSGSKYGLIILWAVVLGAGLKYVLNEGLARWQLTTGTTLLEGWVQRMGRTVQVLFGLYLVLWSFFVGGGLISACGLGAHALIPALSVEWWGVIHSLVAVVIVLTGSYKSFEFMIKVAIGIMFVTIMASAIMVWPGWLPVLNGMLIPRVPDGSGKFLLGVIGGVGGSLTVLAYGYWIRERGWAGKGRIQDSRIDLGVAYVMTGLFGVAIVVLAAGVLFNHGLTVAGKNGILTMASMLGETTGPLGKWSFLVGFWGAVFTSMLGVWQGVPYIFADFVVLLRGVDREKREKLVSTSSAWYRGYLLYLAVPPMLLLLIDRPVMIVVVYAIISSLFMPFLAGTLLVMNNRREWMGEERNGWVTNTLLVLALVVFGYLSTTELVKLAYGWLG